MEKPEQEKNCCKMMDLPSDDELTALNAMRSIKEKVRRLKKQLLEVDRMEEQSNSEQRSALEMEIGDLKAEWNNWEQKRKEAERVRMIILGHEEGSL